ncbi:hypothetical protein GCM10020254_36610 [Streptomyces goshikiensis]
MVTSSTRGVLGPAGEQGLEQTGHRGLADGDGPGDAYDEGRALLGAVAVAGVPEEGVQGAAQLAGGAHVQVEEAGEREVDVPDLVEVDDVAETAQPLDLVGGEGERGPLSQGAPLGPGEVDVRRDLGPARGAVGPVGPVGALHRAVRRASWRRSDHRAIVGARGRLWVVGSVTYGVGKGVGGGRGAG